MREIYESRPFRTRNADEFDLSNVLKLFVSPVTGLTTPFDYDNTLVKGRMGSGKTMFLRANHAYYLYRLLPALIEGEDLVLPVFIQLNNFQHLKEPSEIYRAIIIRIIEELSSIYLRLQDVTELARIHHGVRYLPPDLLRREKMSATLLQLTKLGAEQYVERVSKDLEFKGELSPKFFKASATYKESKFIELQAKSSPGIKDIEECYRMLLEDRSGKILLLLDEAASLDQAFFHSGKNDSFFEILMNQLRTASYFRTKVAIYPHSYQDVLTETRYGDVVTLEESVMDEIGYAHMRASALNIITNYLGHNGDSEPKPSDVFDLSSGDYGDCLEQILYASGGNLRRLIQMLDLSMDRAYDDHKGIGKVETKHVEEAMRRQCQGTEGFYTDLEREYLESILSACRNRSSYRFKFPSMSPVLNKYTSRSQEYNLLNVVEVGSGRRGTTYAFDYAYCVTHDLPTHLIKGSERIDKARSLETGQWVTRVTTISNEILEQTSSEAKQNGTISYFSGGGGFVRTESNKEFYFSTKFLIETDQSKTPQMGKRVRFYPLSFDENNFAVSVELLD